MPKFDPYSLEAYEAHVRHRRMGYAFLSWSVLWFAVYIYAYYFADSIANIATTMFSGGLALAVFKSLKHLTRHRHLWGLVLVMLSAWFVADAIWMVVSWWGFNPQDFRWLENLYTVVNLAMFSALVVYFGGNRKKWNGVQLVLDMAIALFILMIIIIRLYFSNADPVAMFTHAFWTVGILVFTDVASVLILVTMLASTAFTKFSRTIAFLFGGICLYAASDMWYVFQFIRDTYEPNGLMDGLYLISLFLFAAAAVSEVLVPDAESFVSQNRYDKFGTTNVVWLFTLLPVVLTLLKRLEPNDLVLSVIGVIVYYFISHYFQKSMMVEALFAKERELTLQLESLVDERTAQLIEANRILEYKARTDALTGLSNREHFLQLLDQGLAGEFGNVKPFSVLHVDIDRFKVVNDIHGHSMGDQVLLELSSVVEVLLSQLYDKRTYALARIGGDEFGILLESSSPVELKSLSEKIIHALQRPVTIGQYRFYFGATIGVARYPQDGKTAEQLVKSADIAMNHAKNLHNRAKIAIYSDDLINAISRRNQIEWLLHNANFATDFLLYYQPQFSTSTGALIGMEALIRWRHVDEGFISPAEFIPVAEATGMIPEISAWTFETAMRQMRSWLERYPHYRAMSINESGVDSLRMGINVSALLFNSVDFLPLLERYCKNLKVEPSWFDLEITETGALNAGEQVEHLFRQLSDMGFTISIDDFGTGYSALSYLKRFSAHTLKIAKELVDTIADEDQNYLIQAIVMLAQGLKLKTIAEGVETTAQFERLKALGCDAIQGYYLGKPCSAEQFETLYLK